MKSKSNQNNSVAVIAIIVIAIIILARLIFNDDKQKNKKAYQSEQTEIDRPIDNNITEIGNYNDGTYQEFKNKIFKLKSNFYDKEFNGEVIQTNQEATIHKFDFINRVVTLETTVDGQKLSFKYPMNGFYKQKGVVSETNVIKVNTLGVKEIWFNLEVPNLGYDYDDGSRIACYEISSLN